MDRVLYFHSIKHNGRYPDFDLGKQYSKPDYMYPTDFLPLMMMGEKMSVADLYNRKVNPEASSKHTG